MNKSVLFSSALVAALLATGTPPAVHAQEQSAPAASPAAVAAPAAPTVKLPPVAAHKKLRVAVYKGPGATPSSRAVLVAALARNPSLALEDVTVDDIRAGKLDGFDAVVQAGGSGGGQGRALGPEGRANIQEFVKKGGGYLGVCAGAYLATCHYSWSLNLLNARVIDKAHWARGRALITVAPSEKGRGPLGLDAPLDIQYAQGPLLAPAADKTLPAYEEWAVFRGEVAKNGAPTGVMPGTTAVAAAPYGAGRVVCFSPHPEKIDGQEPLLHRALLWATRIEPGKTAPATVAPKATAAL